MTACCIGPCWPLGGSVLSGYCLLNAIISFLFNFGTLLIKAVGNKSLNICFFRGYRGEAIGSSDRSWAIFCCCQKHSDKRATESPSIRKHTGDAVHRANQIIHTQIAQMYNWWRLKLQVLSLHHLWWQNFQVWQKRKTEQWGKRNYLYITSIYFNSNIYW